MAEFITSTQEKKGMPPDPILPTMGDLDLFVCEALAAARTTISQGLNRIRLDDQGLPTKIRAGLAGDRREILPE